MKELVPAGELRVLVSMWRLHAKLLTEPGDTAKRAAIVACADELEGTLDATVRVREVPMTTAQREAIERGLRLGKAAAHE